MLKDSDIRETLIKELNNHNNKLKSSFRLIEELAICDGNARVDVAVANGKLYGYEIKSDADTLNRLNNQVNMYNKTFDKITIVVGEKFESKIVDEVPSFWGIQVAYISKDKIKLETIRKPKLNALVEGEALLELLWRDELYQLLRSKGIKGLSNKNRRILRKIALDTMTLNEIKAHVRETLKIREDWRAD